MSSIQQRKVSKQSRVRSGPRLVREIYQVGSGYVVVEALSHPGASLPRWTPPPGHRVLSAICDSIQSPTEAAKAGRSIARQFDRLGVVIDMQATPAILPWESADAMIAAGLEVAPGMTSMISSDGGDALQQMIETMADDEVVALFTVDVARARKWIRAMGGLATDTIEAKPQSVRRPILVDDAQLESIALAG